MVECNILPASQTICSIISLINLSHYLTRFKLYKELNQLRSLTRNWNCGLSVRFQCKILVFHDPQATQTIVRVFLSNINFRYGMLMCRVMLARFVYLCLCDYVTGSFTQKAKSLHPPVLIIYKQFNRKMAKRDTMRKRRLVPIFRAFGFFGYRIPVLVISPFRSCQKLEMHSRHKRAGGCKAGVRV